MTQSGQTMSMTITWQCTDMLYCPGDLHVAITLYWSYKVLEERVATEAFCQTTVSTSTTMFQKTRRSYLKNAVKLGHEETRAILNTCSGPGCNKIDPTGNDFKSCKCKKRQSTAVPSVTSSIGRTGTKRSAKAIREIRRKRRHRMSRKRSERRIPMSKSESLTLNA